MKNKMEKLTRMLPADETLPTNKGMVTYSQWCRNEVARIGKRALYIEETRTTVDNMTGETSERVWCRVDVAKLYRIRSEKACDDLKNEYADFLKGV